VDEVKATRAGYVRRDRKRSGQAKLARGTS
jgi:hypothetical protein